MGLFDRTHLPTPSAFYLIPSTLKEECHDEPLATMRTNKTL
jgi:hypothetical protein